MATTPAPLSQFGNLLSAIKATSPHLSVFAAAFPDASPPEISGARAVLDDAPGAVFTSKRPATPSFTAIRVTQDFTPEAKREMAEIAARMADPQDFDDYFLIEEIEAAQKKIEKALFDDMEATLIHHFHPDQPLIS